MGEIVNLRKVRKEVEKRDDAERAAANRIVHGRSKAERSLERRAHGKSIGTLMGTGSKPGDA